MTFPRWEALQYGFFLPQSGVNIMYELKVEGMSCGHCVSAVTRAVQSVDAAAKVEVDLAQQKVRVDSAASLDDVKAAVEEAGYPVLAAG